MTRQLWLGFYGGGLLLVGATLAVPVGGGVAYAITSEVTGNDGADGAHGVDGNPATAGDPGMDAEDVGASSDLPDDPDNRAVVTGGTGGKGGNGGNGDAVFPDTGADGGSGGVGGIGGDVTAFARALVEMVGGGAVADAVGGDGGDGGLAGMGAGDGADGVGGDGGEGGHGYAAARAQNTGGVDTVTAVAIATGGTGGDATGPGATGGYGGLGIIDSLVDNGGVQVDGALAVGEGLADASAEAQQYGGHGGFGFSGATGGRGADSILYDLVGGQTDSLISTLGLKQITVGGGGGGSDGGTAGVAGNAESSLTLTDANPGSGNVDALIQGFGGIGGNGFGGSWGTNGGGGFAQVDLVGDELKIAATVEAVGGRGGDSVGGFAGDGGPAVLGFVGVEDTSGFGEIFVDTGAFGGDGGDGFGAGGHAGDGVSSQVRNHYDVLIGHEIFWRQRAGGGDGGSTEQGFAGIPGSGTSVIGDDETGLAIYADVSGGYTQIASAFGGDSGSSSAAGGFVFTGGQATAFSSGDNRNGNATIQSYSEAGRGGDGFDGTDAGFGGNAESTALGSIGGFLGDGDVSNSDLEVFAQAVGGLGGSAELGGVAGSGGDAVAEAHGVTPAGTGQFNQSNVTARAYGGEAGVLFGDADIFLTNESKGGAATATATGTTVGDISTQVLAEAFGGRGGDRDDEGGVGDGGRGGRAESSAELTTANDSFEQSQVTARAVGGTGGTAAGVGNIGGFGGEALVTSVTGIGTGDSTMEVEAIQIGGDGGDGFNGAFGGYGADSIVMDPATATARFTNITLNAVGGRGGSSSTGPGLGGDARVYYTGGGGGTDNVPSVFVGATGGRGGDGTLYNDGQDGALGFAQGTLTQNGLGDAAIFVTALGGRGGDSSGAQAGHGGPAQLYSVFGESTMGYPILVEGTAVGGRGGNATVGGTGGNGGDVVVVDKVHAVDHDLNTLLKQTAIGGGGGSGGLLGVAGRGGDATSEMNRTTPVGNLYIEAIGGLGGTVSIGEAGRGGHATADLTTGPNALTPLGNGPDANTDATGGNGGAGFLGADGGHAGDAHAITRVDGDNASAGSFAEGGEGGDVGGIGRGGDGGDAYATSIADPIIVDHGSGAFANSFGGDGGSVADGLLGTPGRGGNAVSIAEVDSPGARGNATAFARGGRGGFPGLDGDAEGPAGTADARATAFGTEGFLKARAIVETGLINSLRGDADADISDAVGDPADEDREVLVEARGRINSNFPPTDADAQVTVDVNAFSSGAIAESVFDIRATNLFEGGQNQKYEAEAELSLARTKLTAAEKNQMLFGVLIFEEIVGITVETEEESVDKLPGVLTITMDSDGLNNPALNFVGGSFPLENIFELEGEYALGTANGHGFGPDSDFSLNVSLLTNIPDVGLRVRWAVYGLNADQALTNGQFELGLSGWELGAVDFDGQPVQTPHITAPTSGAGNGFAQFKTGEYQDGIAVSTIQQGLVVDAAEPVFSFDFTLATVVEDLTGVENDTTNPFTDRVEVLIDDGVERFLLLVIDRFGVFADPLNALPDGAALNVPVNPDEFDFNFAADLSAFAGMDLTLIIDVINEDDGFRLDPNLDNFQLTASAPTSPVPEPGTAVFLSLGGVGLVWRGRRLRHAA